VEGRGNGQGETGTVPSLSGVVVLVKRSDGGVLNGEVVCRDRRCICETNLPPVWWH